MQVNHRCACILPVLSFVLINFTVAQRIICCPAFSHRANTYMSLRRKTFSQLFYINELKSSAIWKVLLVERALKHFALIDIFSCRTGPVLLLHTERSPLTKLSNKSRRYAHYWKIAFNVAGLIFEASLLPVRLIDAQLCAGGAEYYPSQQTHPVVEPIVRSIDGTDARLSA